MEIFIAMLWICVSPILLPHREKFLVYQHLNADISLQSYFLINIQHSDTTKKKIGLAADLTSACVSGIVCVSVESSCLDDIPVCTCHRNTHWLSKPKKWPSLSRVELWRSHLLTRLRNLNHTPATTVCFHQAGKLREGNVKNILPC